MIGSDELKRNCNGCKALDKDLKFGQKCSLGHEIKPIKFYCDIPVSYKPLEECKKPMTFKALCEIRSEVR